MQALWSAFRQVQPWRTVAAMIEVSFPPSSLSGHAKGNSHWGKSQETKRWRALACKNAQESGYAGSFTDGDYDISVHISFFPPDRRSDRMNFANRVKPIIDGIADGLRVNDRRFVPTYHFCPVTKPGRVEIRLAACPGIVWGEEA